MVRQINIDVNHLANAVNQDESAPSRHLWLSHWGGGEERYWPPERL